MRIGVVTTSYPRTPGDAAGNFVGGHVSALRSLGHHVDVIAAGDARDPGAVRIADSALFYRGGAPDRLEHAPIRAGLAAAAFTARLVAAVARRARHWDAIVAHWLAPSALAALPSTAPLTAIAHGGDIHTLRRLRLLTPVLHALHLRRARLVFVSEELRALARAAAPRLASWLATAIVQPMGLDVAHFTALGRAPTTPPMILVAARLVPLKGVDVAIDAASQLAMCARLVIAGDGPERAALAARVIAHSSSRANPHLVIELVGEVSAAARDQLLREASVVVVPSRVVASGRTEGCPMIALEALAAGVPVVASAVGGLAERGAPIELVPADDPPALARTIEHVLARPCAEAELRAAVADLDWIDVATRLLRNK